MHSFRPWTLLLFSSLATACAADQPVEPLDTAHDSDFRRIAGCRGCVWGPPVLNTNEINGLPTPAIDLTGEKWEGTSLLRIEIGADPSIENLASLEVIDGSLHGIGESGIEYVEDQLVGAAFILEDHRHGWPIETRVEITGYHPDGSGTRYSLAAQGHNPGEGLLPTCPVDPDTGDQAAALIANVEVGPQGEILDRPDTLYFGCTTGAMGKAAIWGYARWLVGPQMYQATVRSVRADYCGDGVSWTQSGTPLQVLDTLGIRDFTDSSQSTEALWGEDGALCVEVPRLNQQLIYEDIVCPTHTIPLCEPGDSFDDHPDALLHTRVWH